MHRHIRKLAVIVMVWFTRKDGEKAARLPGNPRLTSAFQLVVIDQYIIAL